MLVIVVGQVLKDGLLSGFSNGFLINYMGILTVSGNTAIDFPCAYTTTNYAAMRSHTQNNNNAVNFVHVAVWNLTTVSITARTQLSGTYIAIGY